MTYEEKGYQLWKVGITVALSIINKIPSLLEGERIGSIVRREDRSKGKQPYNPRNSQEVRHKTAQCLQTYILK